MLGRAEWRPPRNLEPAKESVMSVQAHQPVHPDIKPENPPERAAHYLDVPNMPWEPTKFPGIKIKVLYTDETGITTALFKLEPGAVVPLHEHTALEQTYVIEGSLEDHEGKCGPGQFVWRPAGNQHEAVAPNGAVLLGFFLKPNRFAYGDKFFTEAGER
jgi:quercetin dioxygenase-like cupin family protein